MDFDQAWFWVNTCGAAMQRLRQQTRRDLLLESKHSVNGKRGRFHTRWMLVARRCACSAAPKELAERLEASDYDKPSSKIEAGMKLHLPCSVKLRRGISGCKIIEESVLEAA